MATRGSAGLAEIEAELSRIGLLLEHDQHLPSVTTLVAGEPLPGSWWGHALGNHIYALLEQFHRGSGALCVKLVNAKRTYVHPRLHGAFFALVEEHSAQALRDCSVEARELYQLVAKLGRLSLDSTEARALGSGKQLTAATRELEASFLALVDSEHTTSGKHVQALQTWVAWRAAHPSDGQAPAADKARVALAEAAARLAQGAAKPVRLALDVAGRG